MVLLILILLLLIVQTGAVAAVVIVVTVVASVIKARTTTMIITMIVITMGILSNYITNMNYHNDCHMYNDWNLTRLISVSMEGRIIYILSNIYLMICMKGLGKGIS